MDPNLPSTTDPLNQPPIQLPTITPPQRTGLKTLLSAVGIVILMLAASGGAYMLGLQQAKPDQDNKVTDSTPTPTQQITPTPAPTPTPTPTWKKLSQHPDVGTSFSHSFDFQYPADWSYRKDGCGFVVSDSQNKNGICFGLQFYNDQTIDGLATQILSAASTTTIDRHSTTVDGHAAVRFSYTSKEQGIAYPFDDIIIDRVKPFAGIQGNGEPVMLTMTTVKSADRSANASKIFDQIINTLTIK